MVQEPDSCSVIDASSLSGRSPRTGAMIRSRYASAACSGLISIADSPGTCSMGVTAFPMVTPRTWLTLEAGSVLTSRTRLPWLTRCKAVAQATDVLPAPPLPVKNRNRGGLSRNFMAARRQQQPEGPQDPPDFSVKPSSVTPCGTVDPWDLSLIHISEPTRQ